MNNPVYLHSFHSILPPYHLNQQKIVDWTLLAHKEAGGEEKALRIMERFCLSEKQISARYYECPDVDANWDSHKIYKISQDTPHGVDIEVRNHFFAQAAQRVFGEMYYSADYPSHLIHVTCTGYVSPSAPQVYFQDKKNTPAITHAYHMGCYASLPSVRMASSLATSTQKKIDIVHTEMCSLHLDPSNHTPEQMVVQTLFADGHMKYSVSEKSEGAGFKILSVKEKLVPHSLSDMTWIPAAYGMKMTLSREVPSKIGDSLPEFIQEMCEENGVDAGVIFKNAVFAIHPGGPKIIESVQKKLELTDVQVSSSKKVLFERGNMSSATLPHVWQEILFQKPQPETYVVSLAFGPGLTIFGSLVQVS